MNTYIKIFNRIEELVASSLLIFTSLLVFVQVMLRYVLNYSLFWSEEISRMMIVWFIFIGSSIAVRQKAHVNMDALPNIVPKSVKYFLEIISLLICSAFCCVIIYAGTNMVISAFELETMATSVKIPLFIPYAAVPVGLFFMLIRYVLQLIHTIMNLKEYFMTKRGEVK